MRPVIVSPVAARLPLLRPSRCAGIPQDVSLPVTQQPARRAGPSGDDGGGCGGGDAGMRFYCCLRKMTTRIFFSQFHWASPGGPRGTPLAQSCLGDRTLNRLCAVSFIMPATPGLGAPGPRTSSGGLERAKWTGWYFTSWQPSLLLVRSFVRITSIPKAGILLTV